MPTTTCGLRGGLSFPMHLDSKLPAYFHLIAGSVALVWFVTWMIFAHDKPIHHPWISTEEREYILSSLGAKQEKKVVCIWQQLCVLFRSLNPKSGFPQIWSEKLIYSAYSESVQKIAHSSSDMLMAEYARSYRFTLFIISANQKIALNIKTARVINISHFFSIY